MKKTVLIDADILLFRVTLQNEVKAEFDGMSVEYSNLEHIKYVFDETVAGIVKKVGADKYVLCFTGDNNFRRNLEGIEYKLNRTGEKPLSYFELKEYGMKEHPSKMYDELEADDVIGIMMTMPHAGEKRIIHSDDKDLRTIRGFIWDRKVGKVVMNPPLEADRFLYTQILTGDPTDGYKGCPKIGKVKAQKLLAECKTPEEMRDVVLKAYIKAYEDEDKAKEIMLQQARLARILRAEDFDFKNKTVKLWDPWSLP